MSAIINKELSIGLKIVCYLVAIILPVLGFIIGLFLFFWKKGLNKKTAIILLGLPVLIFSVRMVVFPLFKVASNSMVPTLKIGDRIIVNKLIYNLREPTRGEVVLYRPTIDSNKLFIHRLIGLPGEQVKLRNGSLFINGNIFPQNRLSIIQDNSNFGPIKVPRNAYFILGDNRPGSFDSRYLGYVPRKNIIGKVSLKILPKLEIIR